MCALGALGAVSAAAHWALPVRLHSLDGTVSFRLDIVWWLIRGDPKPKGNETDSTRQGQGQGFRLLTISLIFSYGLLSCTCH